MAYGKCGEGGIKPTTLMASTQSTVKPDGRIINRYKNCQLSGAAAIHISRGYVALSLMSMVMSWIRPCLFFLLFIYLFIFLVFLSFVVVVVVVSLAALASYGVFLARG